MSKIFIEYYQLRLSEIERKTALLKPDSIILKAGQYNYDDLKTKF